MPCPRVKFCGFTNLETALVAVEAGASALGFVFYEPSPRNISPAQAAAIIQQLPPFVTSVGLFVNPKASFVEEVLAQVPLDLLQFHGDEPESFCQQFKRPYIKALRMRAGLNPEQEAQKWPSARGILLDAYTAGVPGGTGEVFDWKRFPKPNSKFNWILAGGLTPANAAQAFKATQAYALDVSGGVELAKGIKCPSKIQAFMQAVQAWKNYKGCYACPNMPI